MRRFKRIALFLLLLVLVLVGGVWLLISTLPYRIVNDLLGSDLPMEAELIDEQSQWGSFIADGYTLRAFDLPTEFTDHFVSDCAKQGFEEVSIPISRGNRFLLDFIGRHIDGQNNACYRQYGAGRSGSTIVIADSRLIYFGYVN